MFADSEVCVGTTRKSKARPRASPITQNRSVSKACPKSCVIFVSGVAWCRKVRPRLSPVTRNRSVSKACPKSCVFFVSCGAWCRKVRPRPSPISRNRSARVPHFRIAVCSAMRQVCSVRGLGAGGFARPGSLNHRVREALALAGPPRRVSSLSGGVGRIHCCGRPPSVSANRAARATGRLEFVWIGLALGSKISKQFALAYAFVWL